MNSVKDSPHKQLGGCKAYAVILTFRKVGSRRDDPIWPETGRWSLLYLVLLRVFHSSLSHLPCHKAQSYNYTAPYIVYNIQKVHLYMYIKLVSVL